MLVVEKQKLTQNSRIENNFKFLEIVLQLRNAVISTSNYKNI